MTSTALLAFLILAGLSACSTVYPSAPSHPASDRSVAAVPARLTQDEAHALAKRIATTKFGAGLSVDAFDRSAPPHLSAGRWRWHSRRGNGDGDIEMKVSFAEDGSDEPADWDYVLIAQ